MGSSGTSARLVMGQGTLWLGGWAQGPSACHSSLPLLSLFSRIKPSWCTQLLG